MNVTSDCTEVVQAVTKSITANDNTFLLVLGAVNFFLAVLTSVANALVIVAILTTPSLQTPSYLLLTSLAFSDLAVGLICQPLFGMISISFITKHIIAFAVTLVCYMESFKRLKAHSARVNPEASIKQENSGTNFNAIDVLKYKKLLKTLLLIVVLVFVFYLPLVGVCIFLSSPNPKTVFMASMLSMVTVNSTMNPVIYITRMRDIRQACIRILNKLFRCSKMHVN
jgi:hypothetical protein